MRHLSAAVATLALAAATLLGPLSLPAQAAPQRTFEYTIETRGDVRSDVGHFAELAASTLADPRGWSLDGGIGFARVDSGAPLRLVLASPAAVDAAAPGCSANWSCRVGELVLINEERWNTGTRSWTGSLHDYRHYVINHEVGHWLGLGHRSCPTPGAPAPVMQQQSISLGGCRANTWPTVAERTRVAERFGISSFTSPVGPGEGGTYVVQPGDTLGAIAAGYDATWRDIYDANRATIGPDPDLIQVGQRLTIPGAGGGSEDGGGAPPDDGSSTYVVQPGDTLGAIAAGYDATWREIYDANRATIGPDPDLIQVDQQLTIPGG